MLKLHETLNNAFPTTFNQDSKYVSTAVDKHIKVDDAEVTFKLQEGPINEGSYNGIQVPEMLIFIKAYLEVLNSAHPSPYNTESITHIQHAIKAQHNRTLDRQSRGVEGTSLL